MIINELNEKDIQELNDALKQATNLFNSKMLHFKWLRQELKLQPKHLEKVILDAYRKLPLNLGGG